MADQVRAGVQTVSRPDELAEGQNVAIDSNADADALNGNSPRHAPRRASQSCVDLATGIKHEWWNGAWHV
jgi:hypothetical protein